MGGKEGGDKERGRGGEVMREIAWEERREGIREIEDK